ncbi:YwaF family protein [Candidatus Izimaplasma bacterium ZiA1]|uniref:YwaF family protein n=1 Tax=Candidatus Izimoplasma sp. ZiA1 TaxID=2024899 RepID=UPI001F0B1447
MEVEKICEEKIKLREFFDHGLPGEFKYFTLAHFVPILLLLGIIFILFKYQEKIRSLKNEDLIRLTLAFVMIIADMSYFWHKMYIGADIKDHLPITVCGWTAILGGFMLLSKRQTLFDIVYFFALAGSINALITPAVITDNGPTHFRYYQFWIEHLSIFIAVFYMIAVHKFRPNLKSAFKSMGALIMLTIIALYVNANIEGANYLFLSSTENGDSALNFLPTNIGLRIVIMGSIISVLYFIAYLPWIIKDKDLKKVN